VNTTSGAVCSLKWAKGDDFLSAGHTLAQIMYRTFSGAQEINYTASFMPGGEGCWGKPGLAAAIAADQSFPLTDSEVGRLWMPTVKQIWTDSVLTPHTALLLLELSSVTREQFSGPQELQMNLTLASDALHITVGWKNRTLSRMPTAFFLGFNPTMSTSSGNASWSMDVLGSPVDPLTVSYNGAKRLHAVEEGVCWQGAAEAMSIESMDAPLVTPGDTEQTRWDNHQPTLDAPGAAGGMNFVLSDNALWDCIWTYDNEDESFRFMVRPEKLCWGTEKLRAKADDDSAVTRGYTELQRPLGPRRPVAAAITNLVAATGAARLNVMDFGARGEG
jgi:hypothetical protein